MLTYKILGLDIASNTGWSLLEVTDGKVVLKDYGTIEIPSSFTLPQKLNWFNIELERLQSKMQADYCAIEDVILGMSGVSVLAYLARLNGVAIQSMYKTLKENVRLYTPGEWKKNSFDGLNGKAEKYMIQLAICKHFNLATTGDYAKWDKVMTDTYSVVVNAKADMEKLAETLKNAKRAAKKKTTPEPERADAIFHIPRIEEAIIAKKKLIKDSKKYINKEMTKLSLDIRAQTGISSDTADSIGLAFCLCKELKLIKA